MKICVFIAVLLSITATPVLSKDVWLIQGNATGPRIGFFGNLVWASDVVFHNRGTNPVDVRILGVSNEQQPSVRPERLAIPPGRTLSFLGKFRGIWDPNPKTPLWVLHLDVPDEIYVEGTLWIGYLFDHPPMFSPDFGRVAIPAWRTLTSPNNPKIHLNADLGSISGRINVGIYNASASAEASATVEIRRLGCDDLIASHSFRIPSNTLQQFGDLARVPLTGCAEEPGYPSAYVVVKVDQPSLSYVAVVTNEVLPTVPGFDTTVIPAVGTLLVATP